LFTGICPDFEFGKEQENEGRKEREEEGEGGRKKDQYLAFSSASVMFSNTIIHLHSYLALHCERGDVLCNCLAMFFVKANN
jgi:hypothetical protein